MWRIDVMAIINCPECGQEISDKAKKCIHCGKVFVEEEIIKEEIKCDQCGVVLTETDEVCLNCGYPVKKNATENETKPQQVEVASIKMAKKTKRLILGIIIVLIICVAGGVVYKIYLDNKTEQEYQETYNEYIDNLKTVQVLMITGGSDAESLCNLTLKVWANAIYKDYDDETNKYTRGEYSWNDFNTALANLYADSSTTKKVSNIKSNQTSVKDLIKKLQNPPEGLDKCYETVSDLYEAYKKLTDLAINPSGSYKDFGGNKSDAVKDFMASYEKLDNQIPEKIETK